MTRLVAFALLLVVVALPLTVLPSPHLCWLLVPASLVGGLGVVALSAPVTTAGAAVALIAYAVALLIERPPPDLVVATLLGSALVLLLTVVHFARRVHGAAVSPAALRSEIREWSMTVAAGVLAVGVLTIAGTALRLLLPDAAAALVIVGALGALMAVVGVTAFVSIEND